MLVLIYALADPRTDEVRYVGKTRATVQGRLAAHLRAARIGKRTHVHAWIRELQSAGGTPEVRVLESVTGDLDAAERRWIAHGRAAGWNLTNHTDGGDGGNTGGYFTPDARARARAALNAKTKEERSASARKALATRLERAQKEVAETGVQEPAKGI